MNWVKKCKLPIVETIQCKECLYIELEDLWNALHNSFNSTQAREVDLCFLDKIPDKTTTVWNPFSKKELIDANQEIQKFICLWSGQINLEPFEVYYQKWRLYLQIHRYCQHLYKFGILAISFQDFYHGCYFQAQQSHIWLSQIVLPHSSSQYNWKAL